MYFMINQTMKSSARKLEVFNALLPSGRQSKVHISQMKRYNNNIGLKLLTRLRLGLSYLNECKGRHNFQYCINPLSMYSLGIESLSHFFVHCH